MADVRRSRSHPFRRAAIKRSLALLVALIVLLLGGYHAMIRMPGQSYRGPLPPLTGGQPARGAEWGRDAQPLAGGTGGRAAYAPPAGLTAAADVLEAALTHAGYSVERQP